MPALNFSKQFASLVESGAKTQTIRAHRKRPIKVGDRLVLYTGQRTKACRKIGDAVCIETFAIQMKTDRPNNICAVWDDYYVMTIKEPRRCGEESETVGDLQSFAALDGFRNIAEMFHWLDAVHGIPFSGQLVRWRLK